MKDMSYEKPQLKFVSLRNEEAVADGVCWSWSANDGENKKNPDGYWVYDNDENRRNGYIQFYAAGSCGKDISQEMYYIDGKSYPITADGVKDLDIVKDFNDSVAAAGNQLKQLFEAPNYSIS